MHKLLGTLVCWITCKHRFPQSNLTYNQLTESCCERCGVGYVDSQWR
jgi:hypothetical protein